MFWDKYNSLCKKNNSTPNGVAKVIGISNATCTKWKNGTMPTGDILLLVANYFDCSIDYLLDRTNDPQSHKNTSITIGDISGNQNSLIGNNNSDIPINTNNISPQEVALLEKFNKLDEIKKANALLYVSELAEEKSKSHP